jgi:flagellar motility protein MotE (MotC chaperone)
MMRFLRDVRLIPIVLVATISLFALKVSGLVFDGGYTLAEHIDRNLAGRKVATADAAENAPDFPKLAAADGLASRRTFNFGGSSDDITGSVDKDKSEHKDKSENKEKKDEKPAEAQLKTSEKPPGPPKVEVGNVSVSIEPGRIASAGERAVLERLRDRNQELDARKRELDMRENLIKAAEKRLEAKVTELKDTEARVNTAFGNRDKAEAARFGSIVSMYENMKPKDAARIFDRLELNILVDVTTKINPRKMSDILAQMSPDMAERLTVELASRAGTAPKRQGANQLPKIEGKPGG